MIQFLRHFVRGCVKAGEDAAVGTFDIVEQPDGGFVQTRRQVGRGVIQAFGHTLGGGQQLIGQVA